MAASPTPRPRPADPPSPGAGEALRALPVPLPAAVALSGGADSTALLLAAAACWPGQVRAIHVHHGLQAAADGFERHCIALCARLDVPLHVRRVDARAAPGQSPEEAARQARYAALAEASREAGARCVLLGHQADDQAETLLLALSRGAGVAGLAGMAPSFERHGATFLRPFLALPAAQLRRSLAEAGEPFVEDPTNADEGLTRNRIRRRLLPALDAAFPGFRGTFARSARHLAQAQALLDEVAAADLAAMGGEPAIQALRAASTPRQANLLRHWLRTAHATPASTAQLEELLAQVRDCTTRAHQVHLKVGHGWVVRDGPRLRFDRG